MRVCLLHIVDNPCQLSGAEMVFLTLIKDFAKDKEIQVAAALNRGALFDNVSSLGVKVYALPDKRILNIPSFYSNLLKITRDFNPAIVHSHHRYTTFLAQLLPFRHYKLIHTFHLEQFTKRWNIFFGDYATAVSQGCKDHFIKCFNLKADFIEVIYNGIDSNAKKISSSPIEKKEGDIIASVIGRLTEQKGHEILIKAIACLPDIAKNRFKVVFVGDGEKRDALEKLVKHLNLENNVIFAGYQNNVYPYINSSDFTIMPSLWEGFSLAVLESYLYAKPVVGSNIGGIPELIINKKTGLLVLSGDPKTLADAILYFMDNPALVKEFGNAGKQIVLDKFTAAKMIDSYKTLYKRIALNKLR